MRKQRKKHTKFYALAMAVIMLLGTLVTPAVAEPNQYSIYDDPYAEPDGFWALDCSPEMQATWEERERQLYQAYLVFWEAVGDFDGPPEQVFLPYMEALERGEELDDPIFRAYKAYKEAYKIYLAEETPNLPVETPAPVETPTPVEDGITISASAFGFGGMVTVTVTFGPDGIIRALRVDAPEETPSIGGRTAERSYTDKFVGASNGDEVDGIAGATFTSTAVKDAVNIAVKTFQEEKAGTSIGEAPAANTAYASTQAVNVDGKAVTFECYALKDANGNSTNYIKLRDLAVLLNGSAAQFEVGWDGSVTITTKAAYTPNGSELSTPYTGDRAYQETTAVTKVNGQAADLAAFVLNDDQGGGYTYYQLRDLGQALGFNVGWSADKGIFAETNKPYDPNN